MSMGEDFGDLRDDEVSDPVLIEWAEEMADRVRAGLPVDILIAEDNEVNQIVFSQILEGLGYRYAIATDGEEAVRLWRECSPRLILMDITLPKLNGFEASTRIRSLETAASSIPIIGVLAQPFDRDRNECFAAGMNDVILKPISPEALEATFRAHLDVQVKSSHG